MAKVQNETDNLNSYIQSLDVSNVLTVDLGLENHQNQYLPQPLYREQKQTTEDEDDEDENEEEEDNTNDGSNQIQQKTKDIDESAFYDPYNIPGIPPIPIGIDPKKMCPFCQKTFSHAGSMGRHLDLKKGSKNHPADIIEQMRADVKRRGNNEQTANERKRLRAKRYNAKEEVKERVKLNRRVRDKLARAKKACLVGFFNKLGKPQLQPHPTFPRIVLYFLSPTLWPHDPPTLETFRTLCTEINKTFLPNSNDNLKYYEDLMQKVHIASENWMTLTDSIKQDIWIRELRRAAEDALTNTTLFELSNRDVFILNQAKILVENREKNSLGSDTDGETDDEEDDSPENGNHHHHHHHHPEDQFVYNQAELAAVAEAVVNTSKNSTEELDPQLMN